jgi:hypothetical protein
MLLLGFILLSPFFSSYCNHTLICQKSHNCMLLTFVMLDCKKVMRARILLLFHRLIRLHEQWLLCITLLFGICIMWNIIATYCNEYPLHIYIYTTYGSVNKVIQYFQKLLTLMPRVKFALVKF